MITSNRVKFDIMLKTMNLKIKWRWKYMKMCLKSLFCNAHLDLNYTCDIAMEPIIWFVDNFTKFLGPFFVACVTLLMTTVIIICYWIGLPYWWERNRNLTIGLIIFGHWLMLNTLFHYYMGVITPPGYPPEGALIPEAVSICKKCIAPKPPRTHHCSVCNRCVLKMDHHCPWLSNCVGFYNQRYFFMYMVFIVLSTLFIMVFGFELAYEEVWLAEDHGEEIIGHPVHFNISRGEAIWDEEMENREHIHHADKTCWRRRAIVFMAFICSGTFIALGSLSSWHARLIGKAETSIEAHINKSEIKRLASMNKVYLNPYDFGPRRNWIIFLGLDRRRSWFYILFPSWHKPSGDGLSWTTVHSEQEALTSSHIKVT